MKKFLIDYRASLGSYLDEENIRWETLVKGEHEYIYIFCKDVNELFTIACNYERWYIENIEQIQNQTV